MRFLAAPTTSKRLQPARLRCASALVLAALGTASLGAQTFAAMTGTDAVVATHPDASAVRTMRAGHHADAEPSLLFGRVRDGVYTVDGMVAKLRLNYDVNGARFLYLFVPGVGTAVLSPTADPDAVTTEASLLGNELSFNAGDHHFKLTGVALSDGHNTVPEHLYVHLDRSAWRLNRQPMVGFGNVEQPPYAWPGALPSATTPSEESRVIPPVPVTLLPSPTDVTPRAVTVTPVSLH